MKSRFGISGSLLQFAVLMVFITASVSFAGEKLYTFDTDQAWELYDGDWNAPEWKVEGGELSVQGTSGNAAIILLKESEGIVASDGMTIEADCYDTASGPWQNYGIVWSCLDGVGEAYSVMALIQSKATRLEMVDLATGARNTIVNADDEYSPEAWYHMKIEINGNLLTVSTAETGQALIERVVHDFGASIPVGGRPGLVISNSGTKFDNFKVSGPDIVEAAVKPVAKLPSAWARIKAKY